MTTAGIDFGSTLTKAYWQKDGEDHYRSVRPGYEVDNVADEMYADGVRAVRRTGIGLGDDAIARRFEVVAAPEGAVDDEIRLQAIGAKTLMARGEGAPRKMIVAAIGTGASYTIVKGRRAWRHDLGSCHAGGTLMGLADILGVHDFKTFEYLASKTGGKTADLLVKDKLPATEGTDLGELVIAHFCRRRGLEERCASAFNLAACSIAKDLAVLTAIPFSPKDVAVVGTVAASPVFRGYLERWAPMLKKVRLHFPEYGAYAAAVGAWADISL